MGTSSKKWFILGLVGTIIAAGAGVNIITSLLNIMNLNRSINASIVTLLLFQYLYSEMNGGMDVFLLTQIMASISRNIRMQGIYRLTFYIGIVTAVVGGILALVGWINKLLQNKSEMY